MWYTKERKLSFFIALAYVSIGTLSVCSIYPDDPFYNEWFLVGLVFTFPVCKFWISLCGREPTLPCIYHSGNYVCAYFFYPEPSIKGKKINKSG